MSKVQEVIRQIRESLHDSTITRTKIFLNKNKGFWDQLWTSLDVIEDIEVAIQDFKDLGAESFLKVSYIHTYGLLQALYVQQDAVNNLKESIFGEIIKWEQEYPSVFSIRTIRNESIGHPTKNERSKMEINIYCVIDRSSLSREGFSYAIWSSVGFKRKSTKFADLMQKQEEALVEELSKLLEKIKEEEIVHRKKFKGKILTSLLPEGEPYSFSLLRNIGFRPVDHLAWIVFDEFKNKYHEIKKGIELRYGPLKNSLSIPGTELLIDELDRIFLRIEGFRESKEDVKIDLGIYTDALINKLKELKTHLNEIDEEFAK